MRYAAGVLLIIAAIINGIAGGGYALGGGVSAALGAAGDKVSAELAKDNKMSDQEKTEALAAMDKVKNAGGGLMAFGFFLFVVLGLQIAGAVTLFIKKAKMFIFVVAALSILAEIIGIKLTSFGVTNVFGLIGGVLAFLAARSIGAAAPQAAAAPPAVAAGG